ncbi:hypothetical protein FRC01_012980 [Tulasnella sp. 417]|nr:hypothetical protein FRC01_012980 [Tulasnella sp. 417]
MPLDVLYHFGQSTEFSVPIFFGEVSQTSSRWRRLDIAHNGNYGELDWMEEASVPILAHLHLERDLDEDEGTIARPLNLFQGLPMGGLRTITLIGIPLLWNLGQLGGSRLRNLGLHEIRSHAPSVPQILDIIRLSPHLTTLSLDYVAVGAGDYAVLPTLQPQTLKELILGEIPTAAMRQLVFCVRPPRCRVFTIKTTVTEEEAADFFSPGLDSIVPTILRDRNGKRIYINFTSLSTLLSNSRYSHLQVNGDAAISSLEWACSCLKSESLGISGEVHMEVSFLEDFIPNDVPRALQAVRNIPNVVELTLLSNADDWHHGASLLRSLALAHLEGSLSEEKWPFPQLQIVTLGGTHSLVSIFIQMVRTRLGLDSTLGPRVLAQSYPPPIKTVYVRPWFDAHASFSRSELDELQDIIGAGGGSVYWRSKLWKDWPQDHPHDRPDPVLG